MTASEILASTPFFADVLDAKEIEALADRVLARQHARGAVLIEEDAPGDSMFVIVRGKVAVSVRSQELPVATLSDGDIIGEMSLLTGLSRSATVTTISPVTVLEIEKVALEPLLATSPGLVDRFAASLEKRQAELDRLYGTGHWNPTGLADSDMRTLIQSCFALVI